MYWKNLDKIWVIVTHLAAAFLGAFLISFLFVDDVQYQDQKLYQLLDIIENRFVEDANTTTLEDVAAYAMVKATGDQWSYYIPAYNIRPMWRVRKISMWVWEPPWIAKMMGLAWR